MMFKKIWAYITFKKQTEVEGHEGNKYLKMMHGINRISILMFLAAIIIIIIRILRGI